MDCDPLKLLPGKYQVARLLREGAFGRVWLVRDKIQSESKAIKIVRVPSGQDPRAAYAEAQLLRALQHPNILPLESADLLADKWLYLVTPYFRRGSAQDRSARDGMPLRRAWSLICDVLRGVQHAHGHSVLHRDIKPGNVMIAEHGAGVLSDFGLATLAPGLWGAWPQGCVTHLAPEVCETGLFTASADVYAAGVTLYRLVNGDGWLDEWASATEEEIWGAAARERFPPRTGFALHVPQTLRRVVNKAMRADPSRRFGTAADFRHALEQVDLHVDWAQATLEDRVEWVGRSAAKEHRVLLVRRAPTHWPVEVLCKCGEGKPRHRKKLEFKTGNRREAEEHCRKVLSDLATGKVT